MSPEMRRQRARSPGDMGGSLPKRRIFDVAANQSTSGREQQAAIQAAYREILPLIEDALDTYHVLDSAERPGEDDDPLSQQLADLIREGNEADGTSRCLVAPSTPRL